MYVNDATYDNDDNPYGKLIFHQFSNMRDINDTKGSVQGFNDLEIPLVECEARKMQWRGGGIKYYCPDYKPEIHFIHGGTYAEKFSWQRVALHLCDNSPEAEAKRNASNKVHWKCKTPEESYQYYEGKIIGMDSKATQVNIDEDFSKNLYSRDPDKHQT